MKLLYPTRLEQTQHDLPIGTKLTIALEKHRMTGTEVTHTYTTTVDKHYKDGSVLLNGRRAKCWIRPTRSTVDYWGQHLRHSANVIIAIEKPTLDAAPAPQAPIQLALFA